MTLSQVLIDGEWITTEFKNIEEGDRFKMFKDDGEIVMGSKGETEFVAKKGAFFDAVVGKWIVLKEEIGEVK